MSGTRRKAGLLSGQVEDYRGWLVRRGYTAQTVRNTLAELGHLGRWLSSEGVEVDQLDEELVAAFLAARRETGRRRVSEPRAMAPLLSYLGAAGVVPAAATLPPTPLAALLGRYRSWLVEQRNLAATTVLRYEHTARRFLQEQASPGVLQPAKLTGADVNAFLLAECGRLSAGAAKVRVAELRAILRFLHLEGITALRLGAAVPPVGGWRLATVPPTMAAADVQSLLDSCDRGTARGLRDFAVMALVARLGLRSIEVARLQLRDVDWRAGELVVRGKGRRRGRLPLPTAVGEALVGYLAAGRRPAGAGHLSITCRAPYGRIRADLWSGTSSSGPANALACRRWERIGCVMPSPPSCCAAGPACLRSARCFAIRTTSTLCAGSLSPSRERPDERPAAGSRWLPAATAFARARTGRGRPATAGLRRLPEGARLRHGDDRGGAEVGPAARDRPWQQRGPPTDDRGARLRPLPGRLDVATEIPPLGLMAYRQRWRQPFIYSLADIEGVMARASRLISSPLRAATYQTLIGLLAAIGLRVGEAIKLDRGDVDGAEGALLIRESKFGKSRLVPLQVSSMQALADYALLRDELQPRAEQPSFFVSVNHRRLLYAVVSQTFRRLVDATGIGAGHPRLPGCTTCGTPSRSTPCSAGIGQARMRRQDPIAIDLPGSPRTGLHLLVPLGGSGTALSGRRTPRICLVGGPVMTLIAPTLQSFFADRLSRQRQASPRTVAAYRDAMRQLLEFVHQQTGKLPSKLDRDDLNATVITAFLNHLEIERHNSSRTRNLRLTAIRSLFSYAALRHPEDALLIQRVLAIPPKRFDKRDVTFLTEVDALLARPGPIPLGSPTRPGPHPTGRPDRPTGFRTHRPDCADVTLGVGANVRCEGKGRKQRAVPLTGSVQTLLRAWLAERAGRPHDPLFPTRTGRRLSRDAVALRLSTHAATAAEHCPSLLGKRIHPHVLRHSCAMSPLQAGVDTWVIALWLGHAGVRSTEPTSTPTS